MKQSQTPPRVYRLDVKDGESSTLSVLHLEDEAIDWIASARSKFLPNTIRLEWVGTASDDPFVIANPDPPRYVDAIVSDAGGVLLRVRLVRNDDGSIIRTDYHFHEPTGKMTTRALRVTGFSDLVGRLDDVLGQHHIGNALGQVWRREVRRPGRAGRPDLFYAEWARRYVDALEKSPQAPIAHLYRTARAAGEDVTSPEAIRALIHTARSRDLLTTSRNGMAGGKLTTKAKNLLRTADRRSVTRPDRKPKTRSEETMRQPTPKPRPRTRIARAAEDSMTVDEHPAALRARKDKGGKR